MGIVSELPSKRFDFYYTFTVGRVREGTVDREFFFGFVVYANVGLWTFANYFGVLGLTFRTPRILNFCSDQCFSPLGRRKLVLLRMLLYVRSNL